MHERVRAGPHGHAVRRQRAQVVGRHVLVVEGHHRGAGGHRAQRLEVAVVADDGVRDDLGRGDALGLGQQPQRHAERGGRLRQHPGELAAADDRDGRSVVGHGETLVTPPARAATMVRWR